MKQLWKRLKSKTGESLIETLVAILLFTFGSIIMLSMITSSVNINKKAEEADAKYLASLEVVERAVSPREGEYKVSFYAISPDSGANPEYEVSVDVFGGDDGGLYTYYVKGGS